MNNIAKMGCLSCGGKFYMIENSCIAALPEDIVIGEAMPGVCPICGQDTYAVVLKIERLQIIATIQI